MIVGLLCTQRNSEPDAGSMSALYCLWCARDEQLLNRVGLAVCSTSDALSCHFCVKPLRRTPGD